MKKHIWCAWDSNPGPQDGRQQMKPWSYGSHKFIFLLVMVVIEKELQIQNSHWLIWSNNTRLLCLGEYHCTADLLYVRSEFSSFDYRKMINLFTCLVESKPLTQEVCFKMIFPLTKWVYFDFIWLHLSLGLCSILKHCLR